MKKFKTFTSLLLVLCMVMSMLSFGAVPVSAQVASHLVISEVYGGGGNTGALYKNDFIELYNPTASDVNLAGWKVQWSSATGATYTDYPITSGTIKAGGFFLIQAAKGSGGTIDLPTPDAICTFTMGATGFKIKLVDASGTNVIDLVGAGVTSSNAPANEFEGTEGPAPTPSNTTSIHRKYNTDAISETSGGWDTDNNKADFLTAAPTPKNSSFGFETAVANPTANPASGAVDVGTAITLSTSTQDAAITYQLNDGTATQYTTPITLEQGTFVNGTATIKAKATKGGLIDSEEVTFTYILKTEPGIITIQEAKTKPSGTIVRVMGIVTYSTQGRTIFMQDSSGGICVDSGSASVNISNYKGKEIDITGAITLYGGMVQIKPASLADIKITNESPAMPQPLEVTINTLKNSDRAHEGKLIKVVNAQIKTIGGTGTGTYNHIITQGIDEITLRAGALTGRSVGNFITITGVAGYYNSPQVQANVSDIVDGIAPSVESVTANPVSGSLLPIGATVTLSTSTTDANILYTLNNGAEQTIASNSGTVTISEFNQANGTAIIKAKAAKGGSFSPEATFTYTQAKTQAVTASPVGAVSGTSQITLSAAQNATIKYIVTKKAGLDGESSDPEAIYSAPIEITTAMLPVKITAYATQEGYLQSDLATFDYYLASSTPYRNYFGQLHSHTAENSDGSGTLTEAYTYARDTAKLDFFAVTDHSNSFDNKPAADKAGTYNLGAYNKDDPEWVNGQQAAAAARRDSFISVYAFEMTWSGGPGHINTFATEGFVSRNNSELNAKSNDAGLKAYYQLLKDTPNSISQFNHPGDTFGNFSDFSYLDPVIDARISLIEVGNGEGAVGSGAYFASYEEYNKALDKGWHLAPTNNQDNHKGKWGDSNTARTVIYTNDLSVNGLYDALRDMRVYATEDNNLDIVYTLNGEMLGSVIQEVPGQAAINVAVTDPDITDRIQSISIISNGGVVVYSQTFSEQNATLEKTLENPAAGYYYIRVIEADGQIAVTAPVWLGSAPRIGIDSVQYDTMMPVTNEEITLTTKLFNNEAEAVAVKSISYQIKNGSSIGASDLNDSIASSGMYTHTQKHTFTQPGIYTVAVTAVITKAGVDTTYAKDVEINVRDSSKLVYVGIDASHDNEYVAGNYRASMGNFAKLAAKFNVRVVELNTSEALISAMQNPKYKMMVFTTPSRRNGTTGRIPFKSYSQSEIDAVAAFAKSGRTVVITGWGDYYENYSNLKSDPSFTADQHMAAQQNKLLAAIGASLRLADDEAKDNTTNGGQPQRLYLTEHNNYVDPFTQGIVSGQVYSQYGGSTIFAVDSNGNPLSAIPTNIKPTISGHATTFSSDDDKDANAIPPKYNDKVLLMANETVTHQDGTMSTVIAAGGAFMSNFEIQVEVENAGTLPYSNYNILQNIIASLSNISTIAEVRSMPNGTDVVIEGFATTDVYNGSDSNKGFFDCIYVQDQTGGINLFPVSSGVEAGQKIRVTGRVSEYQGEKQLQNVKVTVINNSKNPVAPKAVTPQEAMSPENTGNLVTFRGTVTEIIKDNDGIVGQIMVSGARVYINGYITKGISLANIKVGDIVQVTGLASIGENMSSDTEFLPRIRVRDRGEIIVNFIPTINAGDDATINEGSLFTRTGYFIDSDADTWSAIVNYGDGADQTLALNADKTFSLSHIYGDDGTYKITITVNDGNGGIATDIINVTVNNVSPSIGTISGPSGAVIIGIVTNFSANFTDSGITDTHSAQWNWGDGTSTVGSVTQGEGSGTIANSHVYATAGIYTVTLTVKDDENATITSNYEYDVVIYNPNGGHLTGGGWVKSPKGAYKLNSQLTGKATFEFDFKYLKGASVPVGNTLFQFTIGNLNFKSTSYEWLVISGNKAQCKGSGAINGKKGYKFILTAIDGGINDSFNIKIMNESGEVIYNTAGVDDVDNELTPIGRGSIVIHKK